MAGRGTDILLGGNAEFMARQQTLADEIAEKLPKGGGEVRRRRRVRLLLSPRQLLPRAAAATTSASSARCKQQTDAEHDEVVDARRPAHHRHRAARSAAHRQPAARPRRPPGRPRLVTLLPLARRRPDAHLRLRPHLRADAAARHGRRRADRAQDGHQGHRARAEAGRGAELLASASTCSSTTT